MLFAIVCRDHPNALELRMANRPAHREYLAQHSDRLKLAGPFLDAEGRMCGSLLIVEAADQAEAEAFAAGDPYRKAGLFASAEVTPFQAALGSWKPA